MSHILNPQRMLYVSFLGSPGAFPWDPRRKCVQDFCVCLLLSYVLCKIYEFVRGQVRDHSSCACSLATTYDYSRAFSPELVHYFILLRALPIVCNMCCYFVRDVADFEVRGAFPLDPAWKYSFQACANANCPHTSYLDNYGYPRSVLTGWLTTW